jgi:hypothetical protein
MIIDADGDGDEDKSSLSCLVAMGFDKPVFGESSDIHNTKNGELPGHVRHGEDSVPNKTHPSGDTKLATDENNA